MVPRASGRDAAIQAFAPAGDGGARVRITSEDLATVLLRFAGGATGVVTVGQVCAGHKNDCWLEVCGSTRSLRWAQEQQNQLWIGARHEGNTLMAKDPSLAWQDARRYVASARRPPGRLGRRVRNVMRDIYMAIADPDAAAEHRPALATFDDGYASACLVDAVLGSHRGGGVWTEVDGADVGRRTSPHPVTEPAARPER